MIRRSILTAAVLVLAGCNAPESSKAPADAPAATPSAATAPAVPADALTAEGWTSLRIGMTRSEVENAFGTDSTPETVGGPEPEACDIFHPQRAPEGLKVMIENGVLTSIWLDPGAVVKTDRGFGVGDQASAIKTAYGAAAIATPHKYSPAPAEYVTTWARGGGTAYVEDPQARGISYHIGSDGRVEHVAAGGPSIQYVEGCS